MPAGGGCPLRASAIAWSAAILLAATAVIGCVPGTSPVALEPVAPSAVAVPAPTAVVFAPSGPTEHGRVVHVTDGDTIRVVIDGQEHRLRYIGIDTPESVAPNTPDEPFGEEASEANARLVEGERVVLERDVSNTDSFDRLLRYVWLEPNRSNRATDDDAWRLVNLELVRLGMAEAVDYPPDTKYSAILDAAESQARAAGRGMWARDS